MLTRTLVIVLAAALCAPVLAAAARAPQETWGLYMPERERKPAFKKAYRRGTMKMNFAAGTFVDVVWVTKDVARAIISERVDKERLSAAEADKHFSGLRSSDLHLFIVRFSAHPGGPEFKENSLFLQRAGRPEVFSRGRLVDGVSPETPFRVTTRDSTLVIAFPKRTESGEPLVRALDERVELSLLGQYTKPAIIPISVGEIVVSLADL